MFALEATGPLPPPAQCVPRQAWRDGSASIGERILAEEVPVAFSYDGATHAVLMATPDDLEDFAIGFSYTEGIITTSGEIAELAVVSVADGIVLRMLLTGGPPVRGGGGMPQRIRVISVPASVFRMTGAG